MSSFIRYAVQEITSKIVHVQNVENGLACKCKCLECGEKLEAVQGSIREWYFRHYRYSNCKGGQETAIHKFAKQVILNSSSIIIPNQYLTYSNPREEISLSSIVPDVTVISDGQPVHFEIVVTNDVSPFKNSFYKQNQFKSIEINLRHIPLDIKPEELENIVLNQRENKIIIFWENNSHEPAKFEIINDYALSFLNFVGFIFLFLIVRLLFIKRKSV